MDDAELQKRFWDGVEALHKRFPDITVALEESDEGLAYLASIECETPGKGRGTEYMTALINLADSCEYDIELCPSELGGDRLTAWYERLGFIFVDHLSMIRFSGNAASPGL